MRDRTASSPSTGTTTADNHSISSIIGLTWSSNAKITIGNFGLHKHRLISSKHIRLVIAKLLYYNPTAPAYQRTAHNECCRWDRRPSRHAPSIVRLLGQRVLSGDTDTLLAWRLRRASTSTWWAYHRPRTSPETGLKAGSSSDIGLIGWSNSPQQQHGPMVLHQRYQQHWVRALTGAMPLWSSTITCGTTLLATPWWNPGPHFTQTAYWSPVRPPTRMLGVPGRTLWAVSTWARSARTYMTGSLDEVAVYNYALTLAQVAAIIIPISTNKQSLPTPKHRLISATSNALYQSQQADILVSRGYAQSNLWYWIKIKMYQTLTDIWCLLVKPSAQTQTSMVVCYRIGFAQARAILNTGLQLARRLMLVEEHIAP